MTLRINSLYDSRIEVIKSNHDKAVEIEKRLLDKYQKNRYFMIFLLLKLLKVNKPLKILKKKQTPGNSNVTQEFQTYQGYKRHGSLHGPV